MSSNGSIIFLHGASSSGKSTIARSLQSSIDLPFWHISIDHLRDSGVLPSERIKSGDFDWKAMRQDFFDGFHRSLAAYAGAGNNLIVEHILETPNAQGELAMLLEPFDVLFVAVHCPLAELARREAMRGDRREGSAAQDFATIHIDRRYDLALQSLDGTAQNVARILDVWRKKRPRSQFFNVTSGR